MSADHTTALVDMDFTDETDVVAAQESKPASEYLDKAGTYHFAITKMRPRKGDDDSIYGFEACLVVIATEPGNEDQLERTHWERFNFGQKSHADGGTFCNSRIRTFMTASGKVDPVIRGTYTCEFSTEQYQDLQLIATMKQSRPARNAKPDAPKYFEIDGLSMWHVDDTEVASVPKHKEFLELHTGIRWDAAMIENVRAKREASRAAAEASKGIGGHAKALPSSKKPAMTAAEIAAASADL